MTDLSRICEAAANGGGPAIRKLQRVIWAECRNSLPVPGVYDADVTPRRKKIDSAPVGEVAAKEDLAERLDLLRQRVEQRRNGSPS